MKTPVLLIDKENKIKMGIGDKYSLLENEYEIFVADNYDDVLKVIESNEIEIIVSDLSLEDALDIKLLKKIKNQFPQSFIVVFTGKANKLSVNDIYRFAHQIHSEPYEYEKLVNSFKRREKMVKYLHDGKLMALINNVNDLPTLPETYQMIEEELASGQISLQKIASILSKDLSFTVKILHVVNSPFFGLRYKINNVMQAVNLLGISIIKSLVLYHYTFSVSKIGPEHKKYFEELWIHSNKVGRYAEQILFDTTNNELEMMEEAYIAGLLHDIGKVVMLSADDYPDNIFKHMDEHNVRFSQAEYKIFGTSHSEIGAYFLSLWGLPERTAEAVYAHNKPTHLDFSRFTVENAVFIANLIVHEKELNLEKMQKLNLGVHPQNWITYLEEHKLMKDSEKS